MKAFKVYDIRGAFYGNLTMFEIDTMFDFHPDLWISIHGNREDWPETPSGEFNKSSWEEWKQLYGKPKREPTLYSTLSDLLEAVHYGRTNDIVEMATLHSRLLLAMPDASIGEILQFLDSQ